MGPTGVPDGLDAALTALVATHLRGGECLGLAVAVHRFGEVVWALDHAMADLTTGVAVTPEVVFPIASVTKLFTAAAVLRLVDERKLGLDDPIAAHLPGVYLPGVSLRSLLLHAAGLEREPTTGTVLRPLAVLPPWTRWKYSNVGYGLLGHLVEQIAGVGYRAALTRLVLAPLGLDSTGLSRPGRGPRAVGHRRTASGWVRDGGHPIPVIEAAGGLEATAIELARATGLLLAGAGRLLSPASEWAMADPVLAVADGSSAIAGQALGCLVVPSAAGPVVGHGGGLSGFSSAAFVHQRTGWGATVLANASDARSSALARRLVAEAVHRTPPERGDGEATSTQMLWSGMFRSGDALVEIRAQGGRLAWHAGSSSSGVWLEPLGSDVAVLHGGPYDAELVRRRPDGLEVCTYLYREVAQTDLTS